MSEEKDWILFPETIEMTKYANETAGKINKIWAFHPTSERILTAKWGDQQVVGARGHWAIGQILQRWGILPLDSRIFADHGDKYDYVIPYVGYTDGKTEQIHSKFYPKPSWVEVRYAQKDKPVHAYIFCCWHSSKCVLWVLGWMWRDDFWRFAKVYEAGDKMPNGILVKEKKGVRDIPEISSMSSLYDLTRPKKKGKKNA